MRARSGGHASQTRIPPANDAGATAVITRSTLTGNTNFEAKQQNLSVLQSTGSNTKAGATDGTITPLAPF